MIGNSVFGGNAASVILASGFSGNTSLGDLPAAVVALANLPEPVRLVCANESVSFKLSAMGTDPIRSDTAIYRWLAYTAPLVVASPDVYAPADRPERFQLIKRVSGPEKYPQVEYLRFIIKFVPAARSPQRRSELWLHTVIVHSAESIAAYLKEAVRVGA